MADGGAGFATRRAAAQKAQAVAKRLYGPKGTMRGKQAHKVKSVAEIAARLRDRVGR